MLKHKILDLSNTPLFLFLTSGIEELIEKMEERDLEKTIEKIYGPQCINNTTPFFIAGYHGKNKIIAPLGRFAHMRFFDPHPVRLDGFTEEEVKAWYVHQLKFAHIQRIIVDDPDNFIYRNTVQKQKIKGQVIHLQGKTAFHSLFNHILHLNIPKDLHCAPNILTQLSYINISLLQKEEDNQIKNIKLETLWQEIVCYLCIKKDNVYTLNDLLGMSLENLLNTLSKREEDENSRFYNYHKLNEKEYQESYELLKTLHTDQEIPYFNDEILNHDYTIYLGEFENPKIFELTEKLLLRILENHSDIKDKCSYETYPTVFLVQRETSILYGKKDKRSGEFYNGHYIKSGVTFFSPMDPEYQPNYHYQVITKTPEGIIASLSSLNKTIHEDIVLDELC